MDFVEEELRPRFLFQSRASASADAAVLDAVDSDEQLKTSKLHRGLCLASSALLLLITFYFFLSSQTLSFILVWASMSLLVGPFAPVSLTGGDIRVGQGPPIDDPPTRDPSSDESEEPKKRKSGRRQRQPGSDAQLPPIETAVVSARSYATDKVGNAKKPAPGGEDPVPAGGRGNLEECDWTEEDLDVLKKHMAKHPVGTPRRWELIADAFHGRHGVSSVIKTAKSLSERRHGTEDSFSQFLRHRKPLDRRVESLVADEDSGAGSASQEGTDSGNNLKGDAGNSWTYGEDLALLNALKTFPKDVPLRWEKIAASVPGKTKSCCMKRVADLKRDFRSSKTT